MALILHYIIVGSVQSLEAGCVCETVQLMSAYLKYTLTTAKLQKCCTAQCGGKWKGEALQVVKYALQVIGDTYFFTEIVRY